IYNIGTPVGPRLAELCGCKVWIENDGKAAAIAELQRGALRGCSNAAVFVIGTGVGGGLIINGQLVRGRDFTAGEYSFMNTNADAWSDGKKSMACQCSTSALLDAYRVRRQLPADAPMNGRLFFDAANAGEPEALEVLEAFCMAVDVQIYNLSVLLDLEKVAIGGGISGQPLLIETLDRVYEEKILKGHPFGEEQARSLPRPEIVPCAFHNEANQIGALVSYLNAFYPQK
nr:ROK family protein [Faecalibacterium sp.]